MRVRLPLRREMSDIICENSAATARDFFDLRYFII
jgi:hypothetical protein